MDDTVRKKEKGKSYPGASLPDCIEAVKKIDENLGRGIPHDKDQIAKTLGYGPKSSGGLTKIAALVHFGFLNVEGGRYKLTQATAKVVRPVGDELRQEIQEAFLRPKIYTKILGDYSQAGRIPKELANILNRNYGISGYACGKAAKLFLESGKYAGVIDEEGKIILQGNVSEEQFQDVQTTTGNDIASQPERTDKIAHNKSVGVNRQRFEFSISNGKAILDVPAQLSETDIKIIKKQVELLELQINLNVSDNTSVVS